MTCKRVFIALPFIADIQHFNEILMVTKKCVAYHK